MKPFKTLLTTVLIAVTVIFMPLFSGCGTSAERIAQLETLITTTQQVSASADAQIELIKNAVPGLQQSLSDTNLPPDLRQKALESLNTAKAKLQNIQDAKATADTAIATLQTALAWAQASGNVDIATEIGAYGQGATQLAPLLPPPISGYVAIGGIILSIIGGITAASKQKQATQTQKSLDEVVTANDIYLNAASAEAVKAFKDAQDSIQTSPTVQKVAAIKAL